MSSTRRETRIHAGAGIGAEGFVTACVSDTGTPGDGREAAAPVLAAPDEDQPCRRTARFRSNHRRSSLVTTQSKFDHCRDEAIPAGCRSL